ncbi:MAG: helix-turn-helix domain-containing protein [Planctomycetota bacterium]|nr:helix-turn-helix domain-containing protein [Planctomycetota bacterium]
MTSSRKKQADTPSIASNSQGPSPGDEARSGERQALLSSAQVAALLGLSKRKVEELSASGKLPRIEIGRSVRYDPADVWEFVDRCKDQRRRRG